MSDKYTDLTYSQFVALCEQPDCVLLDVRTQPEFLDFHFENAINIDLKGHDFLDEITDLDLEKQYFVYCSKGIRSVNACLAMRQLGFKHLYNLKGGMGAKP